MPEYLFERGELADKKPIPHRVVAQEGDETIGKLDWSPAESGHIVDIFVEKPFRRRGVATGMFKHAQHISSQFDDVPAPTHNSSRTEEGDAWARSVGGTLPERALYKRQFNNIWNE